MHFSLVDPVLIVGAALLVVHAINGNGFVPYLTELIAFAAGIGLGFVAFGPMGWFIHTRLGVNQGVADFGSFLLVVVLVHAAVQAAVGRGAAWIWSYMRYLPPNPLAVLNAVPAVGVAAMMAVLLVCVGVVLPITGGLKPQITGSLLGSQILDHAAFVRAPVQTLLSPPSSDPRPINIDPTSNPGEDAFLKLPFPQDLQIEPDPAGETRMLQLVNAARAQVSLSSLHSDTLLVQVARQHSADMYQRHYFSHKTPDGKTPYDRMTALRFHYVTAGENLAFAPDVESAFTSLMNSPDHKANILNPDFRCVGIGAYKGLNGYEEMFTQDFADCS